MLYHIAIRAMEDTGISILLKGCTRLIRIQLSNISRITQSKRLGLYYRYLISRTQRQGQASQYALGHSYEQDLIVRQVSQSHVEATVQKAVKERKAFDLIRQDTGSLQACCTIGVVLQPHRYFSSPLGSTYVLVKGIP